MVWLQNDGLLGFLFKSIVSLWTSQRASLCGRSFEARVVFIFHLYSNSFVKACLEARGIKALKKQMVWLQNDGLLGFLFKSIVELWASNGLPFVEDCLRSVLAPFFKLKVILL